ncbi:MAG: hypothetical protein HUU15_07185 [Candidatus Brocadiae bacterium]|nr:hypothetical protein [Candidatus Brocadiia bacterium]
MRLAATLLILAACAAAASAQESGALAPPLDLRIEDSGEDNGVGIDVTWRRMEYDAKATYTVLVALAKDGPWHEAAKEPGAGGVKADEPLPWWAWSSDLDTRLIRVTKRDSLAGPQPLLPEENPATKFRAKTPEYWWKVVVATEDGLRWESQPVQVTPTGNFFAWSKLNTFLYMGAFTGILVVYIGVARKRTLWIRRIAGLDAVDEAVGRATEMGKPVYYMTGRDTITTVSTVAATLILGEIAKKVAAYDTQLKVPHTDAIVMAVCQEITREAYISAGRPDAFREDSNFFVTDDQFGYTAAVDGMMVREKPAACFYMGYYYAESLLLAETGASTGAIQIAGTDADAQLPFFFTACDYTLIGEELYAAGAYLSKEPVLVGTLRGQDIGKAVLLFMILIGAVLTTLGQWGGLGMSSFVRSVVELFKAY